jgi:hypothetical protein
LNTRSSATPISPNAVEFIPNPYIAVSPPSRITVGASAVPDVIVVAEVGKKFVL